MRRVASLALAALVLVPAQAGAGTTRPPLALTATPARVALAGTSRASLRVTNPGARPLSVGVSRAGFTLDRRGRPRVAPRQTTRAAVSWLTVRPTRFLLRAGASRWLRITSRPPARAEPGDHDALVLLTTRPWRAAGVAVRMRIGVVVVVRAPGRVVRRLALGRRLRTRPDRGGRVLELVVVNNGNVTETLDRGRIRLTLRRRRAVASLRSEPRELRPRTSGLVEFRYRGRLRGWVTVRARLGVEPRGRMVTRTFRVKL